ncbi:hypothetical protein NC651_029435 [Populus alba x Populus x berolinensis]|nr:hypothetical protein NC651_029435 [Populus alba x Populus x berolinensis]
MVKNHLGSLSQDIELDHDTFKDIARSSTHTILAACGLEHKRSEVHTVPLPSTCTHIDRVDAGQTSVMRGCCSSCFDSFVRNVVKRIMDTRPRQWLTLDIRMDEAKRLWPSSGRHGRGHDADNEGTGPSTTKMEKVPMNMERDRRINWKGHLKADFTEKALTILKHSEQLSRCRRSDGESSRKNKESNFMFVNVANHAVG